LRFFMIWPMANSQMLISKKPSTGASTFMPRETAMMRTVPRVTTHISARKISNGINGQAASELPMTTVPRNDRKAAVIPAGGHGGKANLMRGRRQLAERVAYSGGGP